MCVSQLLAVALAVGYTGFESALGSVKTRSYSVLAILNVCLVPALPSIICPVFVNAVYTVSAHAISTYGTDS